MELEAITTKLKEIICGVKEDDTLLATIGNESDLINEIGLDSMEMIDFMLQIEESLSIELNFDNINFDNMKSIKSLAEFLLQQKEKQEV